MWTGFSTTNFEAAFKNMQFVFLNRKKQKFDVENKDILSRGLNMRKKATNKPHTCVGNTNSFQNL